MPSYKFEPFGLGSEWLQPIVLRYDLGSCHNNATYVILGRDDKITGNRTELEGNSHTALVVVDDDDSAVVGCCVVSDIGDVTR